MIFIEEVYHKRDEETLKEIKGGNLEC